MANLVIKSNTANKTFDIEQKVFKLPFEKDKVEILITPKALYSIDSKSFNHGLLPGRISKVAFSNLGVKVLATIFIKNKINSTRNIILDVPIYGKSILKIDRFNIIETIGTSGEIIVSGHSPGQKSIKDDKTQYLIKNDLGKKSLVLSKTFTVVNSFKFSSLPSYTINGNANRYKIVTSEKRDRKNT